jgi:hypothetical protein
MLDVADRLLQEIADVVVVEVVHDLTALSATDDQPEMPEHAQLMGDRGRLHLDRGGELVDRTRAGAQPPEDAQPARRGQRLHRVGDSAGEVRVELSRVVTGATVSHDYQYS